MVTRVVSVVAWATLVGLPFVGAGCFSELTLDACGGFAEGEAVCDECMAAGCCAEAEACRASPACAALFDCLAGCGPDPACRAACGQAHPADTVASELSQCRTNLCGDTCLSCGGYFQQARPACDDCARTNCCASAALCLDDPGCRDRVLCEDNCTHPGCSVACRNLYPDTESLAVLAECMELSCFNACDYGHHFACGGEFQWPKPSKSVITIGGRYFDIVADVFQPIPGLTVAACATDECDEPLATGVTDDEGWVELEVPVGNAGFKGHLRVSGHDDYVPLLRYRTTPFLEDEDWGYNMFTRTELQIGANLLGLPPNAVDETSLVLAFPRDCDGTFAAGVTLTLAGNDDPDVVGFYFDTLGKPVVTATETFDVGLQSPEGGGFANVTAPQVTIDASFEGEKVGTITVPTRPGWITTASISPTP